MGEGVVNRWDIFLLYNMWTTPMVEV